MNSDTWLLGLAGYVFACVVGEFVVGNFVSALWKITEEDLVAKGYKLTFPIRPPPTISFWHGVTERAVYVTCVVLEKPEGITVWLAFKAVMRWKVGDKDLRHVSGSPIYMIGTALNVGFGILGGFIATWDYTL